MGRNAPRGAANQRRRRLPAIAGAMTAAALVIVDGGAQRADAQSGPMKGFGFDQSGMDRAVRPGDDFYAYANGRWQARTSIPADRSVISAFSTPDDAVDQRVAAILKQAVHQSRSKIGGLYASYLDRAAARTKSVSPLRPWLAAIDAAPDRNELVRVMARLQHAGVKGLTALEVAPDPRQTSTYIVRLHQSGAELPDRDYYLNYDATSSKVRGAYLTYLTEMLRLAGGANVGDRALAVLNFETKIAAAQWSGEKKRDNDLTDNRTTVAELASADAGFDWVTYFSELGIDGRRLVIVNEPSALVGAAHAWTDTPLPVLKNWLKLATLNRYAAYLSPSFVDAHFAFFGKTLSGAKRSRSRAQLGAQLVDREMGDDLGREYARRYFTPETKAKADAMVWMIVAAFQDHLRTCSWLAPETRTKAISKLDHVRVLIGYPDRWRDYASLEIRRDDLVGNVARAEAFEYTYQLGKLGRPVDRSEWNQEVTGTGGWSEPELVNIGFPAGGLQAPVFDPRADPAVNYGALGAIIGHELSHLFDDQGRKHDADGALVPWWTAADIAAYQTRAARLVSQFNDYTPLPNVHVNGRATLGENLADLIGLQMALDGYHRSLAGRKAPVVGGFTGDQRFFLGYAQLQRTKYREAYLRDMIISDVHAPSQTRLDEVRNLDAWYKAFDIDPRDKLYLAPVDRVVIW
jgi:putative endopeptidase